MNHGEVMPGPGTQTAIQTEQRYQQDLVAVDQLRENPYRPPTNQQLLSEYEIRIRFLAKGCVVSVGCKELAFGSVHSAMSAISEYVDNPESVGNRWKKEFNMVTY